MGNNGNCDVCAGNARNQMDMRRQKAVMYDRYNRGQMMRTQDGCDTCGNVRVENGCNTCGNTKVETGCDACANVRTANTCVNASMQNNCDTCGNVNGNVRAGNNCHDCGNSARDELRGMPLAMGYVPWQNFNCTYEPMQGFRAGTIFPELDKPFYGRRGMR